MPTAPLTALQKALKKQQALLKAQDDYQLALNERKDEVFKIFVECNTTTTINDSLLAGFLLFASNPANKEHPLLAEMQVLAKAAKIPSKPKHQNKKQPKKGN